MSRDKPLWLARGIKTATFQRCPFWRLASVYSSSDMTVQGPKMLTPDSLWMSRDKPLWLGRGIKTATFQLHRFENSHVLHQVVIWQPKAPKCWFQILSKWAVISHSDWREASKLQHFNCSVLKTCMCFIKLRYDSPRPQNADSRFSLNEAVISHSDWRHQKRHQNCNISTTPVWKLACASSSCDMTAQDPKMLIPDSL